MYLLNKRVTCVFLGAFFVMLTLAAKIAKAENKSTPKDAKAAEQESDVKKETAAVVEPIKADEWQETNNRVIALRLKIKMRQDTLKKLVKEKQVEKNPKQVAEILKTMIE